MAILGVLEAHYADYGCYNGSIQCHADSQDGDAIRSGGCVRILRLSSLASWHEAQDE